MADGLILPYLDVPLQHASPAVLKRMKRPGAIDRTLERIHKWREICPELLLRSTFIVGFPGETEQDFQLLLDFIEQAQLDRVGCFMYSNIEGAAANQLDGHVSEEVKQERFDRFMSLQQQISANKLAETIGYEMQVLVDGVEDGMAIARTYGDAPEIDGVVYIDGASHLQAGQFVDVRITDSDEYDRWAELV